MCTDCADAGAKSDRIPNNGGDGGGRGCSAARSRSGLGVRRGVLPPHDGLVVVFIFVFVCILRFVIKNYQHGLIEHILPLVFFSSSSSSSPSHPPNVFAAKETPPTAYLHLRTYATVMFQRSANLLVSASTFMPFLFICASFHLGT